MSSTQHTSKTGGDSDDGTIDSLERGRSAIEPYARNGTIALVASGVLLTAAIRKLRRGEWRAPFVAIAGVALLVFGLRQQSSDSGAANGVIEMESDMDDAVETDSVDVDAVGTDASDRDDSTVTGAGGDDVSSDAKAGLRGPSSADEEPRDPGTKADSEDEGDIQFTRDQDAAEGKANLNEGDPRVGGRGGDADVEIDLSKAAMADEPAEAAGPTAQQSQPTTTKDDSTTSGGTETDPDADEERVASDEDPVRDEEIDAVAEENSTGEPDDSEDDTSFESEDDPDEDISADADDDDEK